MWTTLSSFSSCPFSAKLLTSKLCFYFLVFAFVHCRGKASFQSMSVANMAVTTVMSIKKYYLYYIYRTVICRKSLLLSVFDSISKAITVHCTLDIVVYCNKLY